MKFNLVERTMIGEAWLLNAELLKVKGFCFLLFLGSPELTDN